MTVKAIYRRMPAVREFAGGVSRTTIYDWVEQERFPKPVKLGARAIAWRVTDLEKWAENPEAWQEQSGVAQ